MSSSDKQIVEIQILETVTKLMDSVFRIPGTNFKFGIDPLLNFIPGAGSLAGYGVSAILVLGLIRNGASSGLAVKMVGNVMLDTIIGAVPILGNIWDFTNKANSRNLALMKEHYQEGKHRGSAMPLLIGVAVFFLLAFVGLIIGLVYMVSFIWGLIL